MTITIYHNPRCSKSRKTLRLLEEAGVSPRVVEYLDDPPSAEEIAVLADRLGVNVATIVRTGEAEYKEASDVPDASDNAALAAWLATHPKVLQRPIVVDDESGVAVLGRPPENVQKLLG